MFRSTLVAEPSCASPEGAMDWANSGAPANVQIKPETRTTLNARNIGFDLAIRAPDSTYCKDSRFCMNQVCRDGTGVTLPILIVAREMLHFGGLAALVGSFEHPVDGRDNQLAPSQPDHSLASQRVQGGGGGFARGADQAGEFALRERDGIFGPVGLGAEHSCQVSHVVKDA